MITEKTTQEKIMSNKLMPIILMALNLSFFFYFIPMSIAEAYSTLLAIVGGVITLILSFYFFGSVAPKLFDKIPVVIGLFCISTLFIFGYFFIVKTTNFASNELVKNGVYTEAIIIDKTKFYGKRGNSTQSMTVRFNTLKNKTATANILLSKREYNSFAKGMRLPIKYSSKNPNIARIDYTKLRR